MSELRAYKFINKIEYCDCTQVTHIRTTQSQFNTMLKNDLWEECNMLKIDEDKLLFIQAGIEYFGRL